MAAPVKNEGTKKKYDLKGWLFDYPAWGGDTWRTFHGMTFRYPQTPSQEDRNRAISRVYDYPFWLACSDCSVNFVEELKAEPLTDEVLAGPDQFARWGVRIHNRVNVRLGKPEVDYEDVVNFYFFDAKRDPRKVNVAEVPSVLDDVVEHISQPITQNQAVAAAVVLVMAVAVAVWAGRRERRARLL